MAIMKKRTWERHSNPWSVWTRVLTTRSCTFPSGTAVGAKQPRSANVFSKTQELHSRLNPRFIEPKSYDHIGPLADALPPCYRHSRSKRHLIRAEVTPL
jgi:hypothetical protein